MNTIQSKKQSPGYSSFLRRFYQSFEIPVAFLVPLLIIMIGLPVLATAKDIEVSVNGVEGSLRKNVLASLKIYQKREETDLNDFETRWLLEEAPKNIQAALEPFGYYSPQLAEDVEETAEGLHVIYDIDIGLPILVREVKILIEGEVGQLPAMQKIPGEFPLKQGKILNHTLYKLGKKEIIRKALSLGFLEAGFAKSEIKVHRGERWADILLVLDGGPRFLFGETSSSQDIIDSDLLQRYLHYKEGEPYLPRKLVELQRVLYRTNFFGQVDIRGEKEKADDLKVPIGITLTEPSFYNRYSLGVGYSTDTGMQGRLEWENRLFNKQGHTVSGALKISERESKIAAVYKTPVRDPRHDKLVYIGSWEEEMWDDTETRLFTAGVNFDHRGDRFSYGGGIDFQKERYKVGDEPDDSTLFIPGVNFSMVTTGNVVDTKHGLFLGVKIKGSKEGFISDTDFLQVEVAGKGIVTPLNNWRVIGRFSVGGTLVDDIDSLPPSLRFYAGGDQSVRGYDYKELGRQDEDGNVVGGRYLLVLSAEIERIIDQSWSVAAFLDAGNAMNDLEIDLQQGAGAGVRYRLPFGQIRVDVAVPLSDSDHSFRIHLTVGGDL